MPVANAPLVAFDPQGVVFAIALDSRSIRMYDCRNFEKVARPFHSHLVLFSFNFLIRCLVIIRVLLEISRLWMMFQERVINLPPGHL